MEDKRDFVLPDATEKLSYKFILDTLQKKSPVEEPVATEASPPMEEICGTQAEEKSDPQLEIPTETLEPPTEAQPVASLDLAPGKKYFRIGEVSEILGIEGYVLRYWESEFPNVKPVKASSGHRVYSRKDVEALHLIKHLLYVEKYSIKGAKKRLSENRKAQAAAPTTSFKALKEISSDLKELLSLVRNYNP